MRYAELTPNDSHKNFYRKAIVIDDDNGNEYLQSYDTIVCGFDADGGFHRYWDGYSATTMRHIKAFLECNGMTPINKREWERLKVEPYPLVDRQRYRNPRNVYMNGFNSGRVVYC